MRAVFEGGSGWRVLSASGAAIAVDPSWMDDAGRSEGYRYAFGSARHIDLKAAPPVDAVVITGTGPEQLDLPTLHTLERRVVVVASPLLPVVAADAVEMLGFVVLRGRFGEDVTVGDLRVRFVPPAESATASLPACGVLVTADGGGIYLRGDGGPVTDSPLLEVMHGVPASPSGTVSLSPGRGVAHPTVDRTVLGAWADEPVIPETAGDPLRAGDAWEIGAAVTPSAPADWVTPLPPTEPDHVTLPLAGHPGTDGEARERHRLLLHELPELARDLTLHPPAGRVHGDAATHDGLGPKTFLLTLVDGPAGTLCQYALDVTRSGFVPAHETPESARERYPGGLTLCFDDFIALLRGELHAEDVLHSAVVWNRSGDPGHTRRVLADLFTVARPHLPRNVLIGQANGLIAGWAVELLGEAGT